MQQYHDEQRLTFRLLSYWNRIRASRDFPALTDLNIVEIKEIWQYSFVIAIATDTPYFHSFGSKLADSLATDYTGINVNDAMEDIIINNVVGGYKRVTSEKRPIMDAASFMFEGNEYRYRSLMAPFSDNNQDINFVVGTTNYKILSLS